MKNEKNNKKSLRSSINELDDFINKELSTLSIEDVKKRSDRIVSKMSELEKNLREERKGTMFAFIFVILCFFAELFYLNTVWIEKSNVESDLQAKEVIISKMEHTISLYQKVVETSDGELTYYIRGDSTVFTYRDLATENDSLKMLNYEKDNEINKLKWMQEEFEWKLKNIKNIYGIYYLENNGTIQLAPSKADTALILFNHHK